MSATGTTLHLCDMSNQQLSAFIVAQVTMVEKGDKDAARAASGALKAAGIKANCYVNLGVELTPRETMLWYAGQLIQSVDTQAWFCINSIINCMDKFAVQPARLN